MLTIPASLIIAFCSTVSYNPWSAYGTAVRGLMALSWFPVDNTHSVGMLGTEGPNR